MTKHTRYTCDRCGSRTEERHLPFNEDMIQSDLCEDCCDMLSAFIDGAELVGEDPFTATTIEIDGRKFRVTYYIEEK